MSATHRAQQFKPGSAAGATVFVDWHVKNPPLIILGRGQICVKGDSRVRLRDIYLKTRWNRSTREVSP